MVDNYKLLRNDRSDSIRGGGVAVLLKKSLKFNLISMSSYSEGMCEFIIIEVIIKTSKILLACVYNPHKSYSLENFLVAMRELTSIFNHIIVGGDFNLNLLDCCDAKVLDFHVQIDSLGLSIVNTTTATHFQGCPTLIDLFLVSNINSVIQYQQLCAPGYSKHDLIFLIYESVFKSSNDTTFSYRNYRLINQSTLCQDVLNTNWNSCLYLPLGQCVQQMELFVNNLFDLHVPVTTRKRVSRLNQWMTD